MHPPGSPKIVSTPSISSDLISACDPYISVMSLGPSVLQNENDPPSGRSRAHTRGVGRGALGDYHEEGRRCHGGSVPRRDLIAQPRLACASRRKAAFSAGF